MNKTQAAGMATLEGRKRTKITLLPFFMVGKDLVCGHNKCHYLGYKGSIQVSPFSLDECNVISIKSSPKYFQTHSSYIGHSMIDNVFFIIGM